MKKIILGSYPVVSISLIVGLLPKPTTGLKVAFIPTAADPYENKDFVVKDRDALVSLGLVVTDVDLKSVKGTDLEKTLGDVDIIFVAGGNTFYLLDQMRKSGFDLIIDRLLEKGKIYIGSSAGSVVCCPTIEGVELFDDPADAPDLTNLTGLNLFPDLIIPHAQKEKYASRIEQSKTMMAKKGYKTITLTDEQIIWINGNEIEILPNH